MRTSIFDGSSLLASINPDQREQATKSASELMINGEKIKNLRYSTRETLQFPDFCADRFMNLNVFNQLICLGRDEDCSVCHCHDLQCSVQAPENQDYHHANL